ncbi:hypothetical protein MG293_019071 [Ovis ammon polii]|uniref:Trem-like transcript 2 protein n=1 Tax=Ovis ammon polii TaxID=230172 RepID=A0AAD4TN80_OVIAM|nr:hypothetical protein MG293_019071 [Ovis ammon polii]
MPPTFLLLLLLLLRLQGPVSEDSEGVRGVTAERKGPRYLLQDDTQAKVVNVTMAALRHQDSGRYWCMRNSSGILYPLMGFLLEVSPASRTKGNTPLIKLPNILQSETVVATGPVPTSGLGGPFISQATVFTAGLLTLARPLPSPTSGSTRLTSVMGSSFSSTGLSTMGPRRATGSQTATASPSNTRASAAGPGSTSTKAAHLCTVGAPTMGMCPTSRTLLNHLFPSRYLARGPASNAVFPDLGTDRLSRPQGADVMAEQPLSHSPPYRESSLAFC